MKQFSCGDVVAGCQRRFSGASEQDILQQVASHARQDHHMESVSQDLVDQVRSKIVTV